MVASDEEKHKLLTKTTVDMPLLGDIIADGVEDKNN